MAELECHDKKANGEDCDPCQMYKRAGETFDEIDRCEEALRLQTGDVRGFLETLAERLPGMGITRDRARAGEWDS